MNPTNSVSVSGLIQNTLNTGSSIEACLAELLDNSLGAGATKICITLQTDGTRLLTISDNGTKTMNREGLKKAMTLHARSSASDDRPGRFGFGMKQAGISLTRHHAATTVISKCEESGDIEQGLNMIVADWGTAVHEDVYYPVPQEITMRGLKVWKDYAMDPLRKGTIVQNPCDPVVFEELKAKLASKDVRLDILYKLGVWYNQYLREGVALTVKVGTVSYPVVPIDPLELDAIAPEHKKSIKCAIMKKGEDIRTYFQEKHAWMRYPTARYTNPVSDHSGYTTLGEFKITFAYSSTWSEQSYIQEKYFQDDFATADDMVYLGGLYMKRTKRIIAKEDIKKPGAGDHSLQDMIIRCRGLIEFPTSLDDYFSIMVNKSKMEMDLVHSSVMIQLRKLHSVFVKDLHAKYYPKKKEVVSSDDESDASAAPQISNQGKKETKPTIVETIKKAAQQDTILKPVVASPSPASPPQTPTVSTVTSTPSGPTMPCPDAIRDANLRIRQKATETESQQPTQIKVRESVRTPPKSEQDVLKLYYELTHLFPVTSSLQTMHHASSTAAEGMANLYNSLLQLKEILEKST